MKRNILLSFKDKDYGVALARALSIQDGSLFITVGDADCVHNTDDLVLSDTEYKSVSDYLSLIHEHFNYSTLFTTKINCDEDLKCIFVTGSSGGCGVTSVSEALAEEFTMYYDKRVCVISLDSFPMYSYENDSRFDVRNLVYNAVKFENGAGSLSHSCQNFFKSDLRGVYHINYGEGMNYLNEASDNEFFSLMKFIDEAELFDIVIIDCPHSRMCLFRDLIDYIDTVICIKSNITPVEKSERVRKYLEENVSERNKNIIFVKNNVNESNLFEIEDCDNEITHKNEVFETESNKEINIEYDKESFECGKIMIEGSFGIGIKNIASNALIC